MIAITCLSMLTALSTDAPLSGSNTAIVGVTATVIRPVDFATSVTNTGALLITLENAELVEVFAVGAIVMDVDLDTTVVISDGSSTVEMVITY